MTPTLARHYHNPSHPCMVYFPTWMVDFYGKCRELYHTWILWVREIPQNYHRFVLFDPYNMGPMTHDPCFYNECFLNKHCDFYPPMGSSITWICCLFGESECLSELCEWQYANSTCYFHITKPTQTISGEIDLKEKMDTEQSNLWKIERTTVMGT